jgi:hypothetical protein
VAAGALDTSVIVLAAADDPDDIVAVGAHELDDQVSEAGEPRR